MLNKLKEWLEVLEKSEEFKSYKKENPDSYLTAGFLMIDKDKLGDWQVNFYSPGKHKITTFILNDVIEIKQEDEVFQKEKKEVEKLDLWKVKVGLGKVVDVIKKLREEKYPNEDTNKIILVLQSLNNRQLWNITCLTNTLKVLNVKVDAEDGKVIEEKEESVLNFRRK